MTSNGRHVLTFEGVDEVPIPGPPLICVPTTAGSSADVSQFAIITDHARRVKIAIVSKTVVPDAALIDPEVTTSMDARLTACTGIDALVHAIEACVSNASSPMTDLTALEAVRPDYEQSGGHYCVAPLAPNCAAQLMLGSLYAGMAFSNASLGAVHAMAHSLGGLLDLPHGQANALLLEHVVAYNFEAAPDRYLAIAAAMGVDTGGMDEAEAKAALLAGIATLRASAGITQSLGDIGLRREGHPGLGTESLGRRLSGDQSAPAHATRP